MTDDRITRSFERCVIVRARIATQITSSRTSAASTRWTNIRVATPPSVGTSRPSISGQSRNARPAASARTEAPTISRANAAAAVHSVSRANLGSEPAIDGPLSGSFT